MVGTSRGLSVRYEGLNFRPEDSDITRYEWDEWGRFIVGIEAPGGFVTRYEYDATGRVTARRFDDGYRRIDTTLAYATQTAAALQPERIERNAWRRDTPARRIGQVLLQARFDAQGRRIYQQGADGVVQTLSYDAAGRPVSLRNAAGEQLHWAYDADSRLLAQISQDAQGQIVDGRLWLRDESGRLRATLTPDGIERIHAYLDEGLPRVPAIPPVNRSAAPSSATVLPQVLHDDFGRIVWQSHPEDGEFVTHYENEPGHQRQTQIQRVHAPDARPIEETLIFDHAGRLTERQRNGCAETLEYEGKLLMRLAGCGSTHRYERDALGLITAHHQQQEAAGQPLILSERFHYDAASRLLTRTLADGQVLSYGYDRAGRTEAVRLQRVWRRLLAGLAGEEMTDTLTRWLPEGWRYRRAAGHVRYRPFDTGLTALEGLTHGNGESQQWALPKPMLSAAAPSAAPHAPPERDAYGRQTRHMPSSGPNQGKLLRLIWDDAHQLTAISNAETDAPIARYSYDSLGNRIAKTVFDAQGQGHTTHYAYDTARRLIARTDERTKQAASNATTSMPTTAPTVC